ncbi:helix-turn-helix transcriptional regulator [Roseovarius sp. D22-M7]|uniref:helix-turn-helix transcriptional regulator n=1 Tax=Roseovarius sp. D22-M7 TaxID=3127116 RepID=UPI00301009BE
MITNKHDKIPWLIALIAVQSLCAAFFLWDVANDMRLQGLRSLTNLHLAIETIAALALVSGIVFETRYLARLLRHTAHLEDQVSIAAGAMHEIIGAHFDHWRLTPAESDVAMFAIKGCSVAETARLRGSAEGTVKAQLNAVYRKAGVSGRGALLGLLVDDLLNGALRSDDRAGPHGDA